jgi:hypothetical protein
VKERIHFIISVLIRATKFEGKSVKKNQMRMKWGFGCMNSDDGVEKLIR